MLAMNGTERLSNRVGVPIIAPACHKYSHGKTLAKAAVFAISALLLSGCGPKPGVRVDVQRVLVEVPVPCVSDLPERPDKLTADDLPADARDALRIAVAALMAWQGAGGYGDRAEAVMKGCSEN